jgi:hypothetical protein
MTEAQTHGWRPVFAKHPGIKVLEAEPVQRPKVRRHGKPSPIMIVNGGPLWSCLLSLKR